MADRSPADDAEHAADADAAAYAPLVELIRSRSAHQRPLLVGISGGVAAGKSTTARLLARLLSAGPDACSTEVVSTDAFLLSNAVLDQRGLSLRKGFPESYDLERLGAFLRDLREGEASIAVPVYDHRTYDLLAGAVQQIQPSEVIILEGVNALDPPAAAALDLSVYVDAEETDLRRWFRVRFLELSAAAAQDPGSFFARWSAQPAEQVEALADLVWDNINGVNLVEHIVAGRDRAEVVLVKGPDHALAEIRVRGSAGQ